ncbi:TlyA family RNA methyltransferase [Salibacterium salarium]|uniref:TlyA family RNA methyltransferase n=1 Tax=Salibacterium salarium TaxID=284579 RepID=A0A428N850_9BACI|nr:TlyA family RNA methyltransferase [Salibacterium salarium]RSL34569.1 TlyA family RNA methyltransferase [Salibacterium salarium]
MKKERIDVLLVEQGFFDSREQAKRSIMAGVVLADNERIDKPGTKVNQNVSLRIKGETLPYVSRGGFKLEKALNIFPLNLENKVVIDIGASTGGFTDCALQNGAAYVYSVDVGTNQLAWKLRNHEKVEVMERFNFRYAEPHHFEKQKPEVAVADVSFISLKLLLEPLSRLLPEDGQACLLVKPQFEAGREKVGKKGIVRDRETHVEVLQDIVDFSNQLGFYANALSYSPVTGGDGNIEFLLYLVWTPENQMYNLSYNDINEIVAKAHTHFVVR